MSRGGRRSGAGRPKGSKNKRTLLREKALEEHEGDARELFEMLIRMAKSLTTEDGLRRMCINDVLAYVWGKPVQRNENQIDGLLVFAIQETEDWRGNGQNDNGAQDAPGPAGGVQAPSSVQTPGSGAAVAENDTGYESGA